jgi:hypothetical protein
MLPLLRTFLNLFPNQDNPPNCLPNRLLSYLLNYLLDYLLNYLLNCPLNCLGHSLIRFHSM